MVKVIAEIGINHNGDIDLCKKMITAAYEAGADYVKFQKRNPDVCVPEHQKSVLRDTPWGEMTYLEYKHRIEFGKKEYDLIDEHCKELGIPWFLSVWDMDSLEFATQYSTDLVKIASALCTDYALIEECKKRFDRVIVSTGMADLDDITKLVNVFFDKGNLILFHTVSAYPAPVNQLKLETLEHFRRLTYPTGYSSHEPGVWPAAATVLMGIKWIEKHFTTDKNLWGTDQSASLDQSEMTEFVKAVRMMEGTMGFRTDVLPCEVPNKKKLRK